MSLRVVDLFSGAGGLSEGFRQAGYDVVGAADNDPDACATFRANFPEANVAWGDLRLPAVHDAVVEAAGDQLDVLVGGPPCQAFSQVRNHTRIIDDPRNDLYREFVQILNELRPRAFVMENVPGMREMGVDGQVAEDLALNGAYRVLPQLVNAVDFGVPQTRRRLLFIGLRNDITADVPVLAGSGASGLLRLGRTVTRSGRVQYSVSWNGDPRSPGLAERLADPGDPSVVTVKQAIGDLAVLRVGRRSREISVADLPEPASRYQERMRRDVQTVSNVRVPRINDDTVMRLKAIPKGGNYRDLNDHLRRRHLTGQRWGQETGTGKLERRHYYAYRRLYPDLWSWTLNTKADSVYHWSQPRALSVREFARIQSFPDRFVVTHDKTKGELPGRISGGPAHSMYRQIGNAVPPILAEAVARALVEVL